MAYRSSTKDKVLRSSTPCTPETCGCCLGETEDTFSQEQILENRCQQLLQINGALRGVIRLHELEKEAQKEAERIAKLLKLYRNLAEINRLLLKTNRLVQELTLRSD